MDLPSKNWSPIAGSGPVPWRQSSTLFNGSSIRSELREKAPFEIDDSIGIDTLRHGDKLSASSLERNKNEESFERLKSQSLKTGESEVPENGNAALNCEDQMNTCLGGSQHTYFPKNDSSTPSGNLAIASSSKSGKNKQAKSSAAFARPSTPSTSVAKQTGSHNGLETSVDAQACNGRARGDGQGKNHLLSRYLPRVTDQELQRISGENYIITPLFEKILTASDAGPMGRLILPKRCAEAYLPPISHPEGLPLKVQDLKGNEWITQFRFWPNNNSRMYVLEGVTPCLQSMKLQAGDLVTFSRIEPEGKLVMGGRKASSAPPSDQGNENVITGDGVSAKRGNSTKSAKPDKSDSTSTWLAVNKSGNVGKEGVAAKPSIRAKRKNSTLGSKSKHLMTDNVNMIELKLTWKQAQGVMRQPPNEVPKVVVIEGCEIEEYEDAAPIIGRPTIPATNDLGEKIRWVQCEVCFKWRKMPADILLPSTWTCSANLWDPERSVCSAAQELTAEQLADLLPTVSNAAFKKVRAAKQDQGLVETLEGLDALANLAIQEEGSSSQATTRHPRHKPGCTCIVCMQRPSGKGPKHKHTCDCMVCQSVKRRFKTLMTKREKKLLEKDAVTASQMLGQDADMDQSSGIEAYNPNQNIVSHDGSFHDSIERKLPPSPFKAGIDLNSQPKRDDELPPGTGSTTVLQLVDDATERHLMEQQTHSFSGGVGALVGNQNHQNGRGETTFGSCSALDKSHERMDADCHKALTADTLISASTTQ